MTDDSEGVPSVCAAGDETGVVSMTETGFCVIAHPASVTTTTNKLLRVSIMSGKKYGKWQSSPAQELLCRAPEICITSSVLKVSLGP